MVDDIQNKMVEDIQNKMVEDIQKQNSQSLNPGVFFIEKKIVYQRMYISNRTYNTPQRFPNMCPCNLSQPALSDSQVVGVYYLVYSMYTTDRAGRGCVGTCLEDAAGCCASVRSITSYLIFFLIRKLSYRY